ncbi:nitrite reductase small subunit NirD [Gordonia jinhuaensis]|uniref:tRNA-(Guanine-N1)-methyltransferase n=1 Tax=Gordonia jinhuaensis TaxID=1517702 RepID=A0A916TEQ7_9ACTN|nr:Rieske 2Fe-2S domain-containing protein [Gordonia jinhuaensis]GGB40541.1 tRNA-(guanine-N1)-methyltransferase [Gordonia jinhuaensis]
MTEHVLGAVDEIPQGEGRAYAVDGRQVAVFRLRDGSLRALDAVCPHLGGPLADALIDDAKVVCPLHNRTYSLHDGTELSVDGPGVRVYPVHTDADGTIHLQLTP